MDKRKIFLIVLSVILVAGFFIRLFPVRSGYHYWDETVYLQHAEIITGESPNNYNEFDIRPPLFSLILAGAFMIESSVFSAHVVVAGLSSLAIILVYILGQELYSRQTGVIAAAIYAASPLGIMLSHDVLVDPILPIFWLATALSLTKAFRTDRSIYYLLTGLMASLAVLMKYTSLVILPAIAAIVLIFQLRKDSLNKQELVKNFKQIGLSRNNWLIAAGFLIGFLPFLVWNYISYGSPLHVFFVAWAKSGARDAFLVYLNGWTSYLLIPFYIGLPLFFWKKDMRRLEAYLPVIFILSLYLPLQLLIANKETRFLTPILPFMALIAAEGLKQLRSGELTSNIKFSKSLFVFLILASILILPASMPKRNVFVQGLSTEWEVPVKDTGEWLKQNTDEDTVVYTNYQYPALGYYSKRKIVWISHKEGLNGLVQNYLNQSGYVYYSNKSPYQNPSFNDLRNDPRFELRKSFEDTVYLFYFEGDLE